MCVKGGSKHQRNSLISLMAVSSAAPSISSEARWPAAYKCIINHDFILGKWSSSSFFHPFFAVVPRGEFDYLWCSAPIQSKDQDVLTWFIVKRATLDWFHIAASLRWLCPKHPGKEAIPSSHIYKDDLLQFLARQHLINVSWKQKKQLHVGCLVSLFEVGTCWNTMIQTCKRCITDVFFNLAECQ